MDKRGLLAKLEKQAKLANLTNKLGGGGKGETMKNMENCAKRHIFGKLGKGVEQGKLDKQENTANLEKRGKLGKRNDCEKRKNGTNGGNRQLQKIDTMGHGRKRTNGKHIGKLAHSRKTTTNGTSCKQTKNGKDQPTIEKR